MSHNAHALPDIFPGAISFMALTAMILLGQLIGGEKAWAEDSLLEPLRLLHRVQWLLQLALGQPRVPGHGRRHILTEVVVPPGVSGSVQNRPPKLYGRSVCNCCT